MTGAPARKLLKLGGNFVTAFFKTDHGTLRSAPWPKRRAAAGIALIEVLIAVVVLGIGAGAALSTLTSSNRFAEVNRIRNAALALCQERIDETVASPFSPPSLMPTYFGTWPVPAADTQTSTETVQLHTNSSGTGIVSGTRTTRVSLADATLRLVRVTARVVYQYRGINYVQETWTLRSPD